MLGRLRVFLIVALTAAPVTFNLNCGFTWSEASAQYQYPLCDPYLINYYSFGQKTGSQYWYRNPFCGVAIGCIRRGVCISEIHTDFGGPGYPTKIAFRGCLQVRCNPWVPLTPWAR